MKKELDRNDSPARDQSGKQPNRRNVQGEALQMNENSTGGKEPARASEPPDAGKPNPRKIQGNALQVNEKSVGD
jgi:hypothetical protein